MHKTSQNGFIHSVKVPRIYKVASVIVKKVVEEGGSLKDLVYNSGHKNIKGLYALVVEAIKHSDELDELIKISKILQRETRLQPWLARILITELIYGKRDLKGDSKPVQTVLSYKKEFEKLMLNETKDLRSNNTVAANKPRYVRVNTLHYTPDEVIKMFRREGWSYLPVPSEYSNFLKVISSLGNDAFTQDFHLKELLVFPNGTQFYDNELYQNGSILLQDKASCLPAFLLKPQPHSVVLDMCAAPGMKTTHLSALMKNKGKIYATEIDPRRYKVLCDVIQTCGCTNVEPLQLDALNLTAAHGDVDMSWVNDVEYILVDPSCSGSGMVERVKIFKNEKIDSKRLRKLCRFQFRLLKHALTCFPNVKRVVYSTCSVQPEENEMVVEEILENMNGSELGERAKFTLAEPLKHSWARRGSDEYEHGRYCIFSDPEKDLTNGFFVAVFERQEKSADILGKVEESVPENKTKDEKRKRRSESSPVESNEENPFGEKQKKKKFKLKDETEKK